MSAPFLLPQRVERNAASAFGDTVSAHRTTGGISSLDGSTSEAADDAADSPPHNLDAERAILGTALTDRVALDATLRGLRPEHFYGGAHDRVFSAMAALADRGEAVDIVTVAATLGDGLEAVGGKAFLSRLLAAAGAPENVQSYVAIVAEKATARRIAKKTHRAHIAAMGGAVQEAQRLAAEVAEASSGHCPRVEIVCVADVEPKDVTFLWEPYLPAGKIVVLEGDPGVGKSTLALEVAAAVTQGWPLPDSSDGRQRGERTPANVLFLVVEDGVADTIRPRLDRAGADVKRAYVANGYRDEKGQRIPWITLADVDVIEEAVAQKRPALVVIDPLQAAIPSATDLNRANEVRALLVRLSELADRFGFVALVIRHLCKSQASRNIYRGLGSIDITAAARSILLAGKTQDGRRAIAHIKANLSPLGPAIGYEIDEAGSFYWRGLSDVTAADILAPDESAKRPRDEAEDFLREALAGGPRPSRDLDDEAEARGISHATLKRARTALGVRAVKRPDGWYATLPDAQGEQGTQEAHIEKVSPLTSSHPGEAPAVCRACGGIRYWRLRNLGGAPWRCGTCHPPAGPAAVEWTP